MTDSTDLHPLSSIYIHLLAFSLQLCYDAIVVK